MAMEKDKCQSLVVFGLFFFFFFFVFFLSADHSKAVPLLEFFVCRL